MERTKITAGCHTQLSFSHLRMDSSPRLELSIRGRRRVGEQFLDILGFVLLGIHNKFSEVKHM